MQDADELFPANAATAKPDADTLFPADIEATRKAKNYGIQHSTVQDWIFGDETVSPIAKVLNGFGQGAADGWGANSTGVSDTILDEMKKVGIKADDWLMKRGEIAKAANVAIIRPAAQAFYDQTKWWTSTANRALAAGMGGVVGAAEAIHPTLGNVAQAAFDPGIQATFGPFTGPVGALMAASPALHMVERARELRLIGRGERGAADTAAVEQPQAKVLPKQPEAPPKPVTGAPDESQALSGTQPTPAPTPQDVHEAVRQAQPELFERYDAAVQQKSELEHWIWRSAEAGEEAPAAQSRLTELNTEINSLAPQVAQTYRETAARLGGEAVEPAAQFRTMAEMLAARAEDGVERPPLPEAPEPRSIDEQRQFIADDVAQKLVRAGRPAQEAQAAGALVAERYVTRAARFEGAIGTPEQLYRAEGPEIRGPGAAAPAVGTAAPPPKIDNTHTVVSGANSSRDPNGPVYIDPGIPEFSPTLKYPNGQPVRLWTYIAEHEVAERAEMIRFEQAFRAQHNREPTDAEWNEHYDNVAHPKVANVAEQAKLKADGVDIKAYNAEMDGLLDHIEHKRNENPPPDTITDPEEDIGHHRSSNKVRIGPEPPEAAAPAEAPPITPKPLGPPRGPAAQPEETWSLLQFLAANGGIRADDPLISDLRGSFGGENKFVPGFGQLIRPFRQLSTAAREGGRRGAMTLDQALRAAIDAGYIEEPGDVTGGTARRNIDDLLKAIDEESRGNRVYRRGYLPEGRPADPAELEYAQFQFIEGLAEEARSFGMELTEKERARALEIWHKEGLNDHGAILERLALETRDAASDSAETGDHEPYIPGWDDAAFSRSAPRAGELPAQVPGAERPARGAAARTHGEGVGAQDLWQRFVDRRVEARPLLPMERGYNRDTSRTGVPLRGRVTQEWQPGNVVNVGIVKDLLVAEKLADGSYTLVAKPNDAGKSRSYNTKPHGGIVREKDIDFLKATQNLQRQEEQSQEFADQVYFQRRPTRDLIAEREAEGELGLPGTEKISEAEQAQRGANAPLKPSVEQKPMDVGLFGDTDKQKELFQTPIYYSMVARTVDAARQEKASPEQWLNFIRNQPGVKPEEIEWLGLDDWLKEQKGSVTKQEVMDYIRANQIEVQEVQHGPGMLGWEKDALHFYDNLTREEEAQLSETHRAQYQALKARDTNQPTKFGPDRAPTLSLPGGKNYRELLLTLPTKPTGDFESYLRGYRERFPASRADDQMIRDYWSAGHSLPEPGRMASETDKAIYKSSHWVEPNVVAHIRFDDRVTDGKKTLHVAEVQSDWHQQGRRRGYGQLAALPEDYQVEPVYLNGQRRFSVRDRTGNAIAYGDTEETAKASALRYLGNTGASPVPDAPFKTTWPELALKRMIRYAAENGYERLSWDTGETNAERYDLSKQVEHIAYKKNADGTFQASALLKSGRGHPFGNRLTEVELADHVGKDVADKIVSGEGQRVNFGGGGTSQQDWWNTLSGGDLKVGGEGMRGFYDDILPKAANKIVKKFRARVGEGTVDVPRDKLKQLPIDEEIPPESKTTTVHTLDITPQLKEAAISQGFPLFQSQLGKVTFREDRRPIITLAKTADASTFIHETGHVFLEELMRDAAHDKAPDILKNDAQTTMRWLGVDKPENIKVSHHEKFARGFEQYLREGVAPSKELAGVFARFRDWLLRIYQTLKGLGSEITPEIRGVFDRLLAEAPQRTVIAPELAKRPTLQDIHESDARITEPHHAEPVADTILDEDQRQRAALPPDVVDEHNRGAAQTGTSPAEPAPLGSTREPAEPVAPGGTGGAELGAEPSGGGATLPESPRLRIGQGEAGRLEVEAVGPHVSLDSMPDKLTDKVGNIRLENLNTPADVNAAIKALYLENKERLDLATKGRVGDQAVMDLADAMGVNPAVVASNMERLRSMSVQDDVPLAARIWLMRDVFTKLAAEVSKAMQGDDVAAFAEARQRFLMAHETLSGITAEVGRGLRAFRSMKGEVKDANLLAAMLKQETGKTLFQLRQEMALGRAAETPAQIARMVNDGERSLYQKARSGIISYVINNLISGPVTHATYAAGNTMLQLWRAVPVTGVAAVRDTFSRATGRLQPGEGVYVGEMGARLYGMLAGLRDGWVPAYNSLKTGVSVMKGDASGADMFSGDTLYRPQQIPGRIGYVLESPSRAVAAIHTMHYGMNYEAEISAMAYRDAMGKGLEQGSDSFNASVAEFRQNPPENAIGTAHRTALDQVLMRKPQYGSAQYHFQQFVNNNLAAKLVMPFVQIGTNILRGGIIESTPLAFLAKGARDNLLGRNGRAAQSMQYSQVVLGTGLAISTVSLAMEGLITGGGPSDPRQREVLEMTGWKPYSLKVGGEYIPYRKYLSVLGPLVAGAADMYEVGHAMSEKGLGAAAAALTFGFAEVVMDETWMRGLASTMDAVRHWDRDGGKYLRNFSMDFLPFSIGARQITSLLDPTWRSVRSEMDALRAHIPGLSQGLHPVRDLWGEPQRGGVMMAPSAAVNDPATQALQKAEYYPSMVERKIRGVELSDQQYDDLTRIGGRDAHMHIMAMVSNPGFNLLPQEIRKQQLKNAIDGSRERARSILLMNPELLRAAIELKRKAQGAAVH